MPREGKILVPKQVALQPCKIIKNGKETFAYRVGISDRVLQHLTSPKVVLERTKKCMCMYTHTQGCKELLASLPQPPRLKLSKTSLYNLHHHARRCKEIFDFPFAFSPPVKKKRGTHIAKNSTTMNTCCK